eukprot:UN09956
MNPEITADNVVQTIYICDKYLILPLLEECYQYFPLCLTANNFCQLFSGVLGCTRLLNDCKNFLKHSFSATNTIIRSQEFLNMNFKALAIFLQFNHLGASEEKIWKYLLKWAEYRANNVHCDNDAKSDELSEPNSIKFELIRNITQYVRFALMKP